MSQQRYVGFLRSVNIPKRMLRMADVRSELERLGCTDIATYVQSGNLIWTSTPELAVQVRPALEALAGFEIPTALFTAEEYREVVAQNPWPDHDDPKAVHVYLVPEPLGEHGCRRITEFVDDVDQAVPGERAIYVLLGGNFHTSKLAPKIARAFPLATARNLATIRAVEGLLQ